MGSFIEAWTVVIIVLAFGLIYSILALAAPSLKAAYLAPGENRTKKQRIWHAVVSILSALISIAIHFFLSRSILGAWRFFTMRTDHLLDSFVASAVSYTFNFLILYYGVYRRRGLSLRNFVWVIPLCFVEASTISGIGLFFIDRSVPEMEITFLVSYLVLVPIFAVGRYFFSYPLIYRELPKISKKRSASIPE